MVYTDFWALATKMAQEMGLRRNKSTGNAEVRMKGKLQKSRAVEELLAKEL